MIKLSLRAGLFLLEGVGGRLWAAVVHAERSISPVPILRRPQRDQPRPGWLSGMKELAAIIFFWTW